MIRPVNDFRIGNLVLDEDGELCIIEQLSSDKMECFQQVSNIENKSCISTKYPSNIYAIQLTEEWLLNLGFSKHLKFKNTYCKGVFSVKFTDSGLIYFKYNDFVVAELLFVHQLQNLFFSLTGEEMVFSSTEP